MASISPAAQQELYAFFRALENDPSLKAIYFKANNRPDRKKIIEGLGFDPALIQEAVNSLPISVDGTAYTLSEWLASKNIDPESLAPVRAILNALHRVEQSGALDKITADYGSYKSNLDAIAGGASKASKVPSKITEGAKGVETEAESSAERDGASESSSDITDVRHSYENAANESESEAKGQESAFTDTTREDVQKEVNELKDEMSGDISSTFKSELSTIETDLKSGAINEVYQLLTKAGDELQKELDADGTNAQVTVTETDSAAGNPDGVEIQITDSDSTDKTEGNTQISGDLEASATIDFDAGSGASVSNVDISGTIGVSGSTSIDETNKDGSITGDATFKDQGNIDVNIDPSDPADSTITTSTTGLEINVDAKLNETIKEDYSDGNFSVDGTTTVTGNIDESIDVDLRDPADSTITNEGNNLQIDQDVTVKGTVETDVDGVDISATVTGSVKGDIDISDKGVSSNMSLGDIDVDLKADDTKPIDLGSYDTGDGITTVYATPSASVDLSIDPNTGKVDVTGESVDPNLKYEYEPS